MFICDLVSPKIIIILTIIFTIKTEPLKTQRITTKPKLLVPFHVILDYTRNSVYLFQIRRGKYVIDLFSDATPSYGFLLYIHSQLRCPEWFRPPGLGKASYHRDGFSAVGYPGSSRLQAEPLPVAQLLDCVTLHSKRCESRLPSILFFNLLVSKFIRCTSIQLQYQQYTSRILIQSFALGTFRLPTGIA